MRWKTLVKKVKKQAGNTGGIENGVAMTIPT